MSEEVPNVQGQMLGYPVEQSLNLTLLLTITVTIILPMGASKQHPELHWRHILSRSLPIVNQNKSNSKVAKASVPKQFVAQVSQYT